MTEKQDKQPEKVKVIYIGAKQRLVLNLDYLEEKDVVFSEPDKTALMLKHDAARLIKENPASFKIGFMTEAISKPRKQQPKKDINKKIDSSEIRAFLSAFPGPEAIADYCKNEYGITLDVGLEKENMIEEAIICIGDQLNLG